MIFRIWPVCHKVSRTLMIWRKTKRFRVRFVDTHGAIRTGLIIVFTGRDIHAVGPEDTETIVVEASLLHEKLVLCFFVDKREGMNVLYRHTFANVT